MCFKLSTFIHNLDTDINFNDLIAHKLLFFDRLTYDLLGQVPKPNNSAYDYIPEEWHNSDKEYTIRKKGREFSMFFTYLKPEWIAVHVMVRIIFNF